MTFGERRGREARAGTVLSFESVQIWREERLVSLCPVIYGLVRETARGKTASLPLVLSPLRVFLVDSAYASYELLSLLRDVLRSPLVHLLGISPNELVQRVVAVPVG